MLRTFGFLATLIVASSAAAAAPMSAELAPTGKLRVAVAVGPVGSAFWATKGPAGGKPRGVTIDLATALAQKLGVPLELVVFANSGKITEASGSGTWDVTFVPKDSERAKTMDFGPVYESAEATYLVRPGSPIKTLADVDHPDVHVAGVAGTVTGRAAQASLKTTKVIGYQTIEEIMGLMKAGKVDAFALPRASLVTLSKGLPGSRVLPGYFHETATAIAVPKGHAEALAYVSHFMETAKTDGLLNQILDKNGLSKGK